MRRNIFRLSWSAAAVMLILLVGAATSPATAQPQAGQVLKFEVDPDAATFFAPAGVPGPFYIEGKIYPPGTLNMDGTAPAGATSVGNFLCWGFLADSALSGGVVGVVSQEFEIFGRGKIQVQGVEDESLRAVTGGSDKFRFARGQAEPRFFSGDPEGLSFAITFRVLTGLRRGF